MSDLISRADAIRSIEKTIKANSSIHYEMKYWEDGMNCAKNILEDLPSAQPTVNSVSAADVRPVSEIEKIIESLQEQADIYNARAQELLVEEDGQVSQYTWAVSLRETYRRIIKTLDDLIS